MTAGAATRLLRGLAVADALRILRARAALWLAAAFLAWSASLLAAALGLLGPVPYHAAVMAAVGMLPGFLMMPFGEGLGLAALRRADGDAAAEAWLGCRTGPAAASLEKRAGVALSVGSMRGWNLARPRKAIVAAFAAMAGAGLAAFAAAQAVAIRSGYGVVVSYPDKAMAKANFPSLEAPIVQTVEAPESALPEPDGRAVPPRRPRRAGAAGEDPLADPRLGVAAEGGDERQATGSGDPNAAGDGARQTEGAAHGAAPDGGLTGSGGSERGESSGAVARSPGYEGAGKSMASSPLVDYRARLERQLVEASGVETVLGEAPSAEMVSGAIAAWMSSFDAKVAIRDALDPELAAAGAAWVRAFGPGAGR